MVAYRTWNIVKSRVPGSHRHTAGLRGSHSPSPRSIIPFPWRRMRSAVFLVTTPIRELVSTPVEPRSRRCVPHATFIAPSILYARNNNLCIYYEGAGFPCKDRCKKKKCAQIMINMRVNCYANRSTNGEGSWEKMDRCVQFVQWSISEKIS